MVAFGLNVYCADSSIAVVKIDSADAVTSYVASGVQITQITTDGTYIYLSQGNGMAFSIDVIQFNPSTDAVVKSFARAAGLAVGKMFTDGTYIINTHASNGGVGISRVKISDETIDDISTYLNQYTGLSPFYFDGENLWIGGGLTFYKMNMTAFTLVPDITTVSGSNAICQYDGKYFYFLHASTQIRRTTRCRPSNVTNIKRIFTRPDPVTILAFIGTAANDKSISANINTR